MKVCKNFIEKPEATTCQNCGCEKWEHDVQGKGILEYIKNMPSPFTMSDEEFQKTYFNKNKNLTINMAMGQKAMELFDEALKEELDKIINRKMQEEGYKEIQEQLRKNGFLVFDELFIKTENGKK